MSVKNLFRLHKPRPWLMRQILSTGKLQTIKTLRLYRLCGLTIVRFTDCPRPTVRVQGCLSVSCSIVDGELNIWGQLPFANTQVGLLPIEAGTTATIEQGQVLLAQRPLNTQCTNTVVIDLPNTVRHLYGMDLYGHLHLPEAAPSLELTASGVLCLQAATLQDCSLRLGGYLEATINYIGGDSLFIAEGTGFANIHVGSIAKRVAVIAKPDFGAPHAAHITVAGGESAWCFLQLESPECHVFHLGSIRTVTWVSIERGEAVLSHVNPKQLTIYRSPSGICHYGLL